MRVPRSNKKRDSLAIARAIKKYVERESKRILRKKTSPQREIMHKLYDEVLPTSEMKTSVHQATSQSVIYGNDFEVFSSFSTNPAGFTFTDGVGVVFPYEAFSSEYQYIPSNGLSGTPSTSATAPLTQNAVSGDLYFIQASTTGSIFEPVASLQNSVLSPDQSSRFLLFQPSYDTSTGKYKQVSTFSYEVNSRFATKGSVYRVSSDVQVLPFALPERFLSTTGTPSFVHDGVHLTSSGDPFFYLGSSSGRPSVSYKVVCNFYRGGVSNSPFSAVESPWKGLIGLGNTSKLSFDFRVPTEADVTTVTLYVAFGSPYDYKSLLVDNFSVYPTDQNNLVVDGAGHSLQEYGTLVPEAYFENFNTLVENNFFSDTVEMNGGNLRAGTVTTEALVVGEGNVSLDGLFYPNYSNTTTASSGRLYYSGGTATLLTSSSGGYESFSIGAGEVLGAAGITPVPGITYYLFMQFTGGISEPTAAAFYVSSGKAMPTSGYVKFGVWDLDSSGQGTLGLSLGTTLVNGGSLIAESVSFDKAKGGQLILGGEDGEWGEFYALSGVAGAGIADSFFSINENGVSAQEIYVHKIRSEDPIVHSMNEAHANVYGLTTYTTFTSNRRFWVDYDSGDDVSGTGTSGSPFATIDRVFEFVGKHIPFGNYIHIYVTGTVTSMQVLDGLFGGGRVYLMLGHTYNGTLNVFTSGTCTFDVGNSASALRLEGCNCSVYVYGGDQASYTSGSSVKMLMYAEPSTSGTSRYVVSATNCSNARIYYLNVVGGDPTRTYEIQGVRFSASNGATDGIVANNLKYGIVLTEGANVVTSVNKGYTYYGANVNTGCRLCGNGVTTMYVPSGSYANLATTVGYEIVGSVSGSYYALPGGGTSGGTYSDSVFAADCAHSYTVWVEDAADVRVEGSVYQGFAPSPSTLGQIRGYWEFTDIGTTLSGKTIDDAYILVKRDSLIGKDPITVYFYAYDSNYDPVGTQLASRSFGWGESQVVVLSKANLESAIADNTVVGIGLYSTSYREWCQFVSNDDYTSKAIIRYH